MSRMWIWAVGCVSLAAGVVGFEAVAQDSVTPPQWAYLGKEFPRRPAGAPVRPTICTTCHLPNGNGRPENEAIAGLPRDYIIQQVLDIRSGARVFPAGTKSMLQVALDVTPAELEAAADTYSQAPYVSHVRVVEALDIPKATPAGSLWRFSTDGAREPLGQRIIEGPDDFEAHEKRSMTVSYTAYVPPESVKRGEALAAGDNKRPACAVCHGDGLTGGGVGPPLAGRYVTGAFRQMWAFKSGFRHGAGAAMMSPVVSDLSERDMMDLAAYAATLTP